MPSVFDRADAFEVGGDRYIGVDTIFLKLDGNSILSFF